VLPSYTENGIICTLIDSDNDGLADIVEEVYGTDPNSPDTDGDGLTDYEEIHITGTNPLKYDTDENGINDTNDDMDCDGLSNKNEIVLGTSVSLLIQTRTDCPTMTRSTGTILIR